MRRPVSEDEVLEVGKQFQTCAGISKQHKSRVTIYAVTTFISAAQNQPQIDSISEAE